MELIIPPHSCYTPNHLFYDYLFVKKDDVRFQETLFKEFPLNNSNSNNATWLYFDPNNLTSPVLLITALIGLDCEPKIV